MRVDTLLGLLVIAIAALSAGCRDSATAGGPGRGGGREGRADLRRVGGHHGGVRHGADQRPGLRIPREPDLQGRDARQGRRPPVRDRPQAVSDRRRAGQSAALADRVTARAGEGAGRAGRSGRREGRGEPEEDGARRRPLHPSGGARLDQPAGAGQRGAGQPGEPGLVEGRPREPRERAGGCAQEPGGHRAAVLDNAQLNHSWAKVFSPITGIAGIKNANIGDLIATSTILTTVSQVDPIYVQFPVSEQEYLRFRQPGPVAGRDRERQYDLEITLADGASYPHRGTVAILDRAVGETTGTINIRGVLPNPGDLLRPGQYAKVRAVIDVKKGALLIPQRAVQDLQGVHQVAVVGADETVDLRKVQVGERVGSLWIIGQGLKPGERVIVEGIDRVKAGQKVKPTLAPAERSS